MPGTGEVDIQTFDPRFTATLLASRALTARTCPPRLREHQHRAVMGTPTHPDAASSDRLNGGLGLRRRKPTL